MSYKQRGWNDKYPKKIEIWEIGDKIPEWLSDRARVKFIDGDGNVMIDRRDREDGSYEVISADGIKNLVTVPERNGVICFDGKIIFGLKKTQLEILYEPSKP